MSFMETQHKLTHLPYTYMFYAHKAQNYVYDAIKFCFQVEM